MKNAFKIILILFSGCGLYYGSFYLRYDSHFEEISVQQVHLIPNLTEKQKDYFLTSADSSCHIEEYGVQDNFEVGNYYNKDGKSLMFNNFRFELPTEKPDECIIVEYPWHIFYLKKYDHLGHYFRRAITPTHSRIMLVTLPNLEVKVDILIKGKVNKAMVKNGFLYLENGYGENQVYLKRKLDL